MDRPARQPGPPVDSARLQPDDHADTTTGRNDDGLVSGWLDNDLDLTELADKRERLQRLQADEDLLLALQLHEFTGREWDRFTRELARYSLGVLRAWIRRGTIYGKAKTLTGYGLGRIEGWPDPQTAEDLAAETIVVALRYFRDNVLKTHRWQSAGGASLAPSLSVSASTSSPTSTAARYGTNSTETSRLSRRWQSCPKTTSRSSKALRRPSSPAI
jgi:hypothetical protein